MSAMQQASLDGFTPVQTPAPPEPLRCGFIGRLQRPPVVRVAANGEVLIDAVFEQRLAHHTHLPLHVVFHQLDGIGGRSAHAIATERCAEMTAAGWALVLGRGTELGYHDGAPCLRLSDCYALDACLPPTDPSPETH